MARVEYDDVSKRFPTQDRAAVDHLDLDVADGEFLVLLGPSGCGKTTALRMLAGLEYPDQGDILIDGGSVVRLEPKDRDVALVFQSYALYPHMSVRNNIQYPLRIRKLSPEEQSRKVERVAELLGIRHLLPRRPAHLFVAQFIGSPPMNIIDARHDGGALVLAGDWRVETPRGVAAKDGVKVGLRPEAIQLELTPAPGAQPAEVLVSEPLGSEVIVNVTLGDVLLKVRTGPEVRPDPGTRVFLRERPEGVRVFDASSGAALN